MIKDKKILLTAGVLFIVSILCSILYYVFLKILFSNFHINHTIAVTINCISIIPITLYCLFLHKHQKERIIYIISISIFSSSIISSTLINFITFGIRFHTVFYLIILLLAYIFIICSNFFKKQALIYTTSIILLVCLVSNTLKFFIIAIRYTPYIYYYGMYDMLPFIIIHFSKLLEIVAVYMVWYNIVRKEVLSNLIKKKKNINTQQTNVIDKSLEEQLISLKTQYESKVISEQEYNLKKTEIIKKL